MSIPSLRQKQINEVLDYHRLINRSVFDRNVRSVFASNQAKAEPHRTDIETEANLRERVDRMKTTLQQLVQYSSYGTTTASEGTMEGRTIDISGSKLKSKVDSTLASLLSDYNGLCQFYDAKNRAKVFSESEGNALIGIVKELSEPLIEVIGKTMIYKDTDPSYFQSYRVLKTIKDNIDAALPLLKIPTSLLTEPYFIPNPSKVKPIDRALARHIADSEDEINDLVAGYQKQVPSNETEKRAKDKILASLYTAHKRIRELYDTNDKAIKKLEANMNYISPGSVFTGPETRGFNRPETITAVKNKKLFDNAREDIELKAQDKLDEIMGKVKSLHDIYGEEGEEKEESGYDEDAYLREEGYKPAKVSPKVIRPYGVASVEEELPREDMYIRERMNQINYLQRELAAEKNPVTRSIINNEIDRIYSEIEARPSPTRTDDKGNEILFTSDGRAYYLKSFGTPVKQKKVYYTSGRYSPSKTGKGKSSRNNFPDDSVLTPYLSKHLKPSKFHKTIHPVESSSESDMEPDHVTSSDESEVEGGKRKTIRKKKAVNPNVFIKQGKEGVALLEKIMAKPRGGRKKAVKPLIDNKRDADMWFM